MISRARISHYVSSAVVVGTAALLSFALATGCSSTPSDNDGPDGSSAGSGGTGSGGTEGGGAPSDGGGENFPSVPNGPNGQALNPSTGALFVDYAGYLSKQDIVYEKPNDNPLYGLTVGTGRVGAMVWSDEDQGLTMQVSGVDLSPQGAFAGGRVSFSTTPSLASAAERETFEQRLVLHDGELRTRYSGDLEVTVIGQAEGEVLGIHVEDRRSGVTSATLELSLWDVSALSNSADVPNIQTWRTVTTFADETAAGFSRGQTDPNNFGSTLAASVEGAPFQAEQIDARRVRLTIEPTSSYTIWIANTSRLNAPAHDSVAAARSALALARQEGFEKIRAGSRAFWHDFWARSFVQYSGTVDADYFESFYYLSTYVIAAGAFGDYPFHFINGVFRATGDESKWSHAYWYWNQRDVYASFLASNHPEVMRVWNRMYTRIFDELIEYTEQRYGTPGIWVPETMSWNGSAAHTVNSSYTQDVLSTATEIALHLYAEYLHTGDRAYLEEIVYPFVRESAEFYVGQFDYDASTDSYYMASSNAHETYWDVRNAITDLASVRALFPVALGLSQELGRDAALRAGWQTLLDKIVPYPEENGAYVPHAPPVSTAQNNENVVCELIWPYALGGIGSPDYDRLVQAWNTRPFPYGNVWAPDAIQAARLGLGPQTAAGLRTMIQRYQTYPNGFTDNTNGVFEYWGVHLTAMNESLLQSHGGKLRVFPALPPDADLVTRFTLHAEGGFSISSEREQGSIKYVGVFSERGAPTTLVNPWPGEEVRVLRLPDGEVLLTSDAEELSFSTQPRTLYVVEPLARPFSSYEPAFISAEPNSSAKQLADGTASLGISRYTPEEMGKYEAENGALVDCNASGDDGASGRRQVTSLRQGSSITVQTLVAGSALTIRYCTDNDPGRLALYVDDMKRSDLVFPTTNSWGGTYGTLDIAVDIPAGASIKLQLDAGGSGTNIDYFQVRP